MVYQFGKQFTSNFVPLCRNSHFNSTSNIDADQNRLAQLRTSNGDSLILTCYTCPSLRELIGKLIYPQKSTFLPYTFFVRPSCAVQGLPRPGSLCMNMHGSSATLRLRVVVGQHRLVTSLIWLANTFLQMAFRSEI